MNMTQFKQVPILGILRGITKADVAPLFHASFEGGLRTIEITLNTDRALELISVARTEFGDKMTIGAGTVLTKPMAVDAIKAGATFLVAPNVNQDIADYCHAQGVAYIPGALTPAEVYTAWLASTGMVKVFPASVFGPAYFAELKGPFNDVELMAVGDVTVENVRDFFACGARAVAIGGSTFYNKQWIATGNWEQIQRAIAQLVEAVHNIRTYALTTCSDSIEREATA